MTPEKWSTPFFILLLALVSCLFLYLLSPFFSVLFWSATISLAFYPFYKFCRERGKMPPNLASLVTLVLCVVLVVMPLLFIFTSFLREGVAVYNKIHNGEINPLFYVDQLRNAFPEIQELLQPLDLNFDDLKVKVTNGIIFVGGFLARNAVAWGGGTLQVFLDLCLVLYIAFFMLREGTVMTDLLAKALPLGDQREKLLFGKFIEVTRATLKGSLVVSIVQGALGGIIFWVLGIDGPLLWGVAMAVLSLLPVVGAGLIWAPAAVGLLLGGEWIEGTVLIAFGVGVIGLVDNILRPFLVGRDTKLPDYMVLLSTLGGFMLFGFSGFIAGPLVAVLFLTFWDIFTREFNTMDEDGAPNIPDVPPTPEEEPSESSSNTQVPHAANTQVPHAANTQVPHAANTQVPEVARRVQEEFVPKGQDVAFAPGGKCPPDA